MMRLKSDLVEHCLAALNGKLDSETTDWDERTSIGVVLAAGGYPDDYHKGDVISGLDSADNINTKIFSNFTMIRIFVYTMIFFVLVIFWMKFQSTGIT